MAAGVASTVAVPPLDAMRAAPCAAFPDFHLDRGAMTLEILAVVGHHSRIVGLDLMERIGQCHIALVVVMTVCFAIRGDVNKLRPRACVRECGCEAPRKVLAFLEQ